MRNLLFVAIFTLAFSGIANADDKKEGYFLKKMTEELNLTSEQQAKLKAMHDAKKGDMKAKRKEMKALHEDLEKALQSSASEDEVEKKFEALQVKQNEFGRERFEKILQVRAILTPEQRAKMRGMPDHHHMGKWGKRGKRAKGEKEE